MEYFQVRFLHEITEALCKQTTRFNKHYFCSDFPTWLQKLIETKVIVAGLGEGWGGSCIPQTTTYILCLIYMFTVFLPSRYSFIQVKYVIATEWSTFYEDSPHALILCLKSFRRDLHSAVGLGNLPAW